MINDKQKFLFRAANTEGFPITSIVDDQINWAGDVPSGSELLAIQLEAKRIEIGQAILKQMANMGHALVAKYPITEQQGWPQKLAEATAVSDGSLDAGDAFQLGIEASITGESVADLAAATMIAAQLTGMIPAITAGLRRKLEEGVASASTEADLDALRASADQVRGAIMAGFATGDPANVKMALAAL